MKEILDEHPILFSDLDRSRLAQEIEQYKVDRNIEKIIT